MLHAIGIYDCSSGTPKKISSAQQDSGLFASNQLEVLEKKSLPASLTHHADEKAENTMDVYYLQNEHHYIKRLSHDASIYLVISAKKKLMGHEPRHLFANIQLAYGNPGRVNFTLDNIIRNPLGYTGKSKLIETVSNQVEDIKTIIREDIKKAMDNGEKLVHLDEMSDDLEREAVKFHNNAKKANSCCRW
jgi:hypothetical protein